ncbi:MAG: helix-turn-helix domain-containing protein [Candidatus Methanomethylicia archaeon]|jgi:Fic family protein|nr:helix-turn-helix domain-containing protein [Candidatus Methanomethylicia archaeon]MCQ5373931.1 helix-turn-helix domain-containing protein [Candidatus Methanomethylicia archaeon]
MESSPERIDDLYREFGWIKDYLEEILSLQRRILQKLDSKKTEDHSKDTELDAWLLLRLPDHLRKTMMALAKLVEARADEVAKITGRARAIESGYLNQLVRMGYVKKVRKKHQIYFSVEEGYKHG